MLDELTVSPIAIKPRVLTAHPEIMQALPCVKGSISFRPFVNYLKQKLNSISGSKAAHFNYLIKRFEAFPELLQPVTDETVLDEQADLMELLTTSLFPVICHQEHTNFALASPYQFRVFYYSEPFRELFFDAADQYLLMPDGIPTEELKQIQCAAIYDQVLEKFYGMHGQYPGFDGDW